MKTQHKAKPKRRPTANVRSSRVTAADARVRFAELLKAVESGQTVTIERYNKPIARLVPAEQERPKLNFGFLDGLGEIVDPDWDKKPTLTDEELEALGEANY
jgi:prevent-host-death family protein